MPGYEKALQRNSTRCCVSEKLSNNRAKLFPGFDRADRLETRLRRIGRATNHMPIFA